MGKNIAQLERKAWLTTKKLGKARFIRREILQTATIVLVVIAIIDWSNHDWSRLSVLVDVLVMLPIAVLGGYLSGRWQWKDLEKKFPEDSLPPWQ